MPTTVPPFIADPLRELKRRLGLRFRERLADVRLFGSWARGTPRVGSDIDVIVLVEGLSNEELTEALAIATELQIETGTTFSLRVMPKERFDFLVGKEVGFALDVLKEGISA